MNSSMIAWMASTLHIIWGLLLIFSIDATRITGLNLLYTIVPNRFMLAAILICSSLMALMAVLKYNGTKSIVLLLPQQFLLVVPAIAVLQAIGVGHFADGVARSRVFLTADKASVVLLAIYHTHALINFHRIDEETVPKEPSV